MLKKFVSLVLCLCLLSGFASYAYAQTDDIISSMVHIKAREDFRFRYDLANKESGESAPIENDYYLSAYKVTNAQYKKFVDETSHSAPKYWTDGTYPEGKADHPVLYVSYSDAVSYCQWLSSKYDSWTFRLPTEAEWENAAMGEYYADSSAKYPDGSSRPSYNASTGELTTTFNYNGVIASKLFKEYGTDHTVTYVKGDFEGISEALGECISISESGGVTNWATHGKNAERGYFLQTDLYAQISAEGGFTTPVGSFAPNTLGLYDMAGNSWDLTSSVVVANNGVEKGVSCYAVRGGSWYATARSCTFHYRGEGRKDHPSSTVGFRLAADYAPQSSNQENITQTEESAAINDNQMILTIGEKEAFVFGETIENDVAPVIWDGRTYLPVRFICESLGLKVEWNEETRQVIITK